MKKKQSFLLTGGTGSFGKAFVSKLINSRKDIKRLVIFSRDELKQSEMAQTFPTKKPEVYGLRSSTSRSFFR